MLSRQATLQYNSLATNQAVSLTTSENPSPNWLLSLLQWMDSHKLQLTRQGTPTPSLFSKASHSQATLLQQWNIQYSQDILSSSISTASPLHLPSELNSLHDLLSSLHPDSSPTTLCQHQLWKLQTSNGGIATELGSEVSPIQPDSYAEILGWENNTNIIHVQLWQSTTFDRNILRPTLTSSLTYTSIFLPKASHERYLYHQTPTKGHLDQITILQHPILRTAPSFNTPYSSVWTSLLAPT